MSRRPALLPLLTAALLAVLPGCRRDRPPEGSTSGPQSTALVSPCTGPAGPGLAVARWDGTRTVVSLLAAPDFEASRPCAVVEGPVRGLAAAATSSLFAWTDHEVLRLAAKTAAGGADPPAAQRLWTTAGQVICVTPASPPRAPRSGALLILTADRLEGGRPLGAHLYLLLPSSGREPRLLSPEPTYNFWDVSVGNVDGDGAEDVALCTWSYTARDPEYARRFFVYGWDRDGDLYPRWRGSRLSRPYVAARLLTVAPGRPACLVSVELAPDGGRLVATYGWNQFGFRGTGHTPVYRDLTLPQPGDLGGDGRVELVSVETDQTGTRRPCVFGWSAPVGAEGAVALRPLWVGGPLGPGQQVVVVPGPWALLAVYDPATGRARMLRAGLQEVNWALRGR